MKQYLVANLQNKKRERKKRERDRDYIIKICADHSGFGKQWFANWLNVVGWVTSSGKTICILSIGTSSTTYNI